MDILDVLEKISHKSTGVKENHGVLLSCGQLGVYTEEKGGQEFTMCVLRVVLRASPW
jgi:hypothetical protein